jgi:hypothetical protein
MTRILWVVCALAGAAFLVSLAFPALPVGGPPPGVRGARGHKRGIARRRPRLK